MFGNYLSTALGNLLRNKLLAAINLLGLALGLATAILIGLYIRDEVTFERFLPGFEQVYRVQSVSDDAEGRTSVYSDTPHDLAAPLRDQFPEFAAVTRHMGGRFGLRRGPVEAREYVPSVDPNFLDVIGLPLIAGDAATALAQPNTMLLSRAAALKYFDTIECVGQTLEIDRATTVRVTGVFEDLPSNTHFYGEQFLLSGLAPVSTLARSDRLPPHARGSFSTDTETYGRLKPGATATAVDARLPALMAAQYPSERDEDKPPRAFLAPIASLHLHAKELGEYDSGGDLVTVYAISATGVLVLLVAGINFINLVTARATRRAVEVGVRKAAGATQRQLMLQFLGESIIYTLAALVLAVALVELVLPSFNQFLDRTIQFAYWRDPILAACLVVLAVAIGLLAGVYPAFVLSSFRPAVVLKGTATIQGAGRLRQILVVLQYAISITLLIATAVIYRQTEFATEDSLRFDKSLVLAISLGGMPGAVAADGLHFEYDQATVERMHARIAALPGVKAVADSWVIPDADTNSTRGWLASPEKGAQIVSAGWVLQGFGVFELYGIKPIAGRSFELGRGGDDVPIEAGIEGNAILNESAVRAFGFASPEAAIGQEIGMPLDLEFHAQPRRIIGVIPDFPLNSIRTRIKPTVFFAKPSWSTYLNVKLTGQNVAQTLVAIDQIWAEMVTTRPINRQFIDDRIARLYRDVTRQGQVFGGFALIAVLIACLGLFGLAAFTAERRTKEIGIRKAMGADTSDILKLLVWEFAKPVLLANVIAWPLAYLAMSQWLDGFAYRISLDPAIFIGAGLIALIIACSVTLYHALQMARSRPVLALHYE